MTNTENLIHKWIKNLILVGDLPLDIIDKNFYLEDGMTLKEYWDYELYSFKNYSSIFDLNDNFNIKIINECLIDNNKKLCNIYVINSFNKIAFKMTITINFVINKISSNNYLSQIVPKYGIKNNEINFIGMAIKSREDLETIISTNFEKEYFSKGLNFKEDNFYSVKFNILENENIKHKTYNFYLKYKNILKPEKRVVFFDDFRIEDCPYIIRENKLIIKNESYPVNLSIFKENNENINFIYPRNKEIQLENKMKIIITDVLDNDWELNQ